MNTCKYCNKDNSIRWNAYGEGQCKFCNKPWSLKDELDKNKFKSDYNHMRQFKFNHKDIKAFSILGVSVGLNWQKIQEKFKILVKKFHPDMNSGNIKYEEKLKLITLAYTCLLYTSPSPRDRTRSRMPSSA